VWEYVIAFGVGIQVVAGIMVFATAMTVLLGRWITADESVLGLGVRGAVLLGLIAVAFAHFGTIWYWLILPLAAFPLLEFSCGGGLAAGWLNHKRQKRLAEAAAAAADHATNAVNRVHLARSLLETGQVDVGLAALDAAVAMADEESRELLQEMADEARRDFVKQCPACRAPNRVAARVCGACLRALCDDLVSRAVVWVSRPALRLLPRPN
jgi:hypothetical protein